MRVTLWCPLLSKYVLTQTLRHKVKLNLNSEFYFSLTGCINNAKEPNLPYYLHIVGGKDEFMPFPRACARSEIQTASAKIWTGVSDFISYNDNLYTNCITLK